jgi:enoyl-[acyl-carrier protein] reductase III
MSDEARPAPTEETPAPTIGEELELSSEPRLADTRWALILGASSGFGAATALALAKAGFHIAGVHLDMRRTIANAEEVQRRIKATGQKVRFFNMNAADPDKRREMLDAIQEEIGPDDGFRIFMHSLAFGSLVPFLPTDGGKPPVTEKQMDMTLNVMAHSLVYWTQDLVSRKLLQPGSRILAMTSSGSHRVIPNYGVVSAAKAALESHIRVLAMELAPTGITANCIQAGVTDTPALRMIPGHEQIAGFALERHPAKRLTTPGDVARFIVLLTSPDVQWINGDVIRVDGVEDALA